MTLIDDSEDSGVIVVDAVVVVAIVEEGGMLATSLEQIEDMLGVDVWTVVKRHCNDTRLCASSDDLTVWEG
jgi:hypothetical protein